MNFVAKGFSAFVVALGLAACSGPSDLYLLPEQPVAQKLGTAARTVEVETINLPDYAKDVGIAVLTENGVLRAQDGVEWADSPDRAMTLVLAGNLDAALSAQVAPAPWPFLTPADVLVVVNVSKSHGTLGGSLTFAGQYFLTSPAGGPLERAQRFNIVVPVNGEGLTSLADAQSRAIAQLAGQIAQDISRVSRGQV
ncbi:membrane integrity-associated transporter subunit PqiC [Pseudoruegeria sp. SHC-113]|uniref:PqiC family protein n=1 Tax=Pseudoruegeria sp. SHC-113 TaxID=2855439 RepID=UPI0021BA679E|nr:PqiC family protein [Pseudoruegeria sp. SHC-113]MCT8161403.1 PqiC family protein [Pseudoruegeria sp. SHC-113]